jgi:hypothetical protein
VKAIAKLSDGQEFWHNIVLFAVAQQLARFRNDVELYATQTGGRTADLRIVTAGIHSLHIEIKAPEEILPPYREITPDEAAHVVAAKFCAAGTGRRGQLPPDHGGLLCIAGVSLSDQSRNNLRAALDDYLSNPATGAHIAGGMIASLGMDLALLPPDFMSFQAVLSLDLVENSTYSGPPIVPPRLSGSSPW